MSSITSSDTIDALCKTIAVRSPFLYALQMTLPHLNNAAQISRSFSELIPILSKLTSISIPIHFMTRGLFTILSRLPRLEGLLLSIESNIPYAESLIKQIWITEEETTELFPFHSLKQIYVTDDLMETTFTLAKALGHGIRFHKLIHLNCTPYRQDSDQVISLMEWVSIACPIVCVIDLSGKHCVSGHLPWQAIQALLQCKNLHTLRVLNSTINMELEDIVTVATNRRSWEVLVLPSSEALGYQALVVFAENCPWLVELGLTLNDRLGFPELRTDICLSSLVTLNVGESTITSQTEVVRFLASICRSPIKIESGNWCATSWKSVEELVDFITTRVQMLKGEIALLQSSQLEESRSVKEVGTGI
ncbi:hypothetical protein Clacol_010210 [Clathrus columnatus]|uniref:Uncharacterized protein n=1 Tax=Clathrus columnatus TaxID=1419009 RepID=A0AAV5AMQ7_9AGAM|nr:hypothetical protein Clacol_010210 [Clathrus columnatus]